MDRPRLKKKDANRRCVTSVFKEASRSYFLTLTSCATKTQSPLSRNTFFQFLLGVVVGERSAPGKIIVCVRQTSKTKRERLARNGVDITSKTQNILISPLFLPYPRLQIDVFWILLLRWSKWRAVVSNKGRLPPAMGGTLRNGSSVTVTQQLPSRKERPYPTSVGRKPRLLRQRSTLLKYYTLNNTQDSEIW